VGNSLGWLIVGAGLLAAPPAADLTRYEYSQVHMGMPFTLILYAPDQATANRASAAGYARIAELDLVMSDYKADSELSQLVATAGQGKAVHVSDDFWRVLLASQELSKTSDGAFDVTVGPYVKLWRRARRDKEFPTEKRLAEAREAVGYQHLKLDPAAQTATLERPGMRLDLGGIAVGYALDEALKVIEREGITSVLLDGSGDVLAGDPPPGKPGWRLAIAAPNEDAAAAEHLLISGCAATTAGDTFQFVELDGKRYSHVVDPRSGMGLTTRIGVTVIAPDAMTADSLDTAASVLGVEAGAKLIADRPGCAALFTQVEADGTIARRKTPGFEPFVAPAE
jgi:thiamine biosynthesis lipoprotein